MTDQTETDRRERYAAALYATLEVSPTRHPWETLSPLRRAVWYARADAAMKLAGEELQQERERLFVPLHRAEADNARLRAVSAAVPAPATTQAALRDRIADALLTTRRTDYEGAANHRQHRYDARCALCAGDVDALADAVLSVLPAPFEAALPSQTGPKADSKAADQAAEFTAADLVAALRGAGAERDKIEAKARATTDAEDPARIDRLRPEFFEHASVESIDSQIRRAQTQQRQWGNRARTLAILRKARVKQKELGEWPAAVQQPKEAGL